MITYREFSAWIMVEGRALPEYLVSADAETKQVSCWIPSETGKIFSVHWRDHGSQVPSCAFIYLDGFGVPGRFLKGRGGASREGVRTGQKAERPFMFAEPTNPAIGATVNRELGAIKLKIRRVQLEGIRSANPLQRLPKRHRSQSGQTNHYVSYWQEQNTYTQYPYTWKIAPYDKSSNRSYVTFVFRYRSPDFLISQGIMHMGDSLRVTPPPAIEDESTEANGAPSVPVPT